MFLKAHLMLLVKTPLGPKCINQKPRSVMLHHGGGVDRNLDEGGKEWINCAVQHKIRIQRATEDIYSIYPEAP